MVSLFAATISVIHEMRLSLNIFYDILQKYFLLTNTAMQSQGVQRGQALLCFFGLSALLVMSLGKGSVSFHRKERNEILVLAQVCRPPLQ